MRHTGASGIPQLGSPPGGLSNAHGRKQNILVFCCLYGCHGRSRTKRTIRCSLCLSSTARAWAPVYKHVASSFANSCGSLGMQTVLQGCARNDDAWVPVRPFMSASFWHGESTYSQMFLAPCKLCRLKWSDDLWSPQCCLTVPSSRCEYTPVSPRT